MCADASRLPFHGSFDLISATFNVLNHLPGQDAVRAMVHDMSRLLASNGLLIFDINTRLGLEQTASLTVVQDSDDSFTHWRRRWLSRDVLRLEASGGFLQDGTWHRYQESIDKVALSISWLEKELASAGLGNISWVSNDLLTPLDEPERHPVAFALVRPRSPSLS